MEEFVSYTFEKIISDNKPTDFKIKIIKMCIEQGCDINQNDSEAIISSVMHGDYELTKFLLENGADIKSCNDYLVAELCELGFLDILQLLVEWGASLSIDDNIHLQYACSCQCPDIVKYLLEKGINCNYPNNMPIKKAFIGNGNLEVKKLLLDNGADPNTKYDDPYTHTILEQSIRNADYDSCNLLLEYGADISLCQQINNDHKNNYKWLRDIPIRYNRNIRDQMKKVVNLLLEHGVDLSNAIQYY